MTLIKLKKTVKNLNSIIMQKFEFNGIKIQINFVCRAKHSKKWKFAEHCHPWFEFNFVSSGEIFTTIEGNEFRVTAGQSYLIPPGVLHSHRHDASGDDGICIRFSLHSDKESHAINVLSRTRAEPFDSGIEKFGFSHGIYTAEAEFAAWLMYMYENSGTNTVRPQQDKNTFSSQVIMYLEEYFREKIKTHEIAEAMNTSYRTLSRKFKAETGMCISEKLTEIRLSKAKQLLAQTDLKIYEIAEMCGFESEFYFSGIFKKNVNVSPTLYRQNFGKK